MVTSTKRETLTEISPEMISGWAKHHWHHTIGFLRIDTSGPSEDAFLKGSGILVKAGGVHAILTADHVREKLPSSGRLGLVLSDKTERTTIDISELKYISIDRGDDSGLGPDIAAVIFHDPIASSIAARKSFYDLDRHRDQLLNSPPEIGMGVWIAQGFVDELTKYETDPSPYERAKGFCQYAAAGGVDNYISNDRHDYYRFPLTMPPSDDVPKGFGGCSGGGLWQVILSKSDDGEIVRKQSLLQGLMYWQEEPRNGLSALKCHGPTSIYDVAHSAISRCDTA